MILNNTTKRGIMLFVKRTLTQRCRIEREVQELDSLNAPTRRMEVMADNVPCRLISTGTRNQQVISDLGAQETMSESYRIIVETSTRLDVDTVVTCDERVYRVVRAVDKWTDEVFREYVAVMRRGGDGEE